MSTEFNPLNPMHQAAQAEEVAHRYGGNIKAATDKIVNYINTTAQTTVLASGDTNIKSIIVDLLVSIGKGQPQ